MPETPRFSPSTITRRLLELKWPVLNFDSSEALSVTELSALWDKVRTTQHTTDAFSFEVPPDNPGMAAGRMPNDIIADVSGHEGNKDGREDTPSEGTENVIMVSNYA